MKQSIIQANALSKDYVSPQGKHHALTNVSFELAAGQTMALLGHNGAGKSTLIKLLLGLISPSSGEVLVLGQRPDLAKSNLNTGYLPENVSFYENMTGADILKYFAALKGVNTKLVANILQEFGLQDAGHCKVRTYSKGMRQRLGLAQAILATPKLLLLDEPTVGLDPLASAFLYNKIRQLKNQGCAVVVCTHELGLVEPELDKALIIGKGQVLAQGNLVQLRQASDLPVKIGFGDFHQRIVDDHFLSAFIENNHLLVMPSQRSQVIDYLTQERKICDLLISQASLQDIFHHFMRPFDSLNIAKNSVVKVCA